MGEGVMVFGIIDKSWEWEDRKEGRQDKLIE
jgi:hypothetical protein